MSCVPWIYSLVFWFNSLTNIFKLTHLKFMCTDTVTGIFWWALSLLSDRLFLYMLVLSNVPGHVIWICTELQNLAMCDELPEHPIWLVTWLKSFCLISFKILGADAWQLPWKCMRIDDLTPYGRCDSENVFTACSK